MRGNAATLVFALEGEKVIMRFNIPLGDKNYMESIQNRLFVRLSKISLIATIACLFTLFCSDNILAYDDNFIFIKHVMSMDTTFHDQVLMTRAITNEWYQKVAYLIIVILQGITAIICWIAVYQLCRTISSIQKFQDKKIYANLGLSIGALLYLLVFIVIAGEWFSMWQSKIWNSQSNAGLLAGLIMLVLIYVNQNND
jgi:predicted small integral membrane protein